MENKKTAVDLLVASLPLRIQNMYASEIENAWAMEKEQIKDAWENGFMSTGEGWNGEIPPDCQGEILDTEQYYNETYGK